MAILGNDVTQDLVNIKPEDFPPIPSGEYILQITKTEQKKTKNGTGAYISITFDIIPQRQHDSGKDRAPTVKSTAISLRHSRPVHGRYAVNRAHSQGECDYT